MTSDYRVSDVTSAVRRILDAAPGDLRHYCDVGDLDPRIDFRWSNLDGADFSNQDLEGFDFTGASLRGANLRGAKLRGARLEGADLTDAKLDISVNSKTFSDFLHSPTDWTSIEVIDDARLAIIEALKSTIENLDKSASDLSLSAIPISWYQGYHLVQVGLAGPQEFRAYFIYGKRSLTRLTGTSPPIHELNAMIPIELTRYNAVDYLRFFCWFVRGEEGPFYLVEDISDPWLPSDLNLQEIEATLEPVRIERDSDGSVFECRALVWYSTILFDAGFRIYASGMVEMVDDNVVADLSSTLKGVSLT